MDKTARTEVPIHELLARRWSPRAFADRAVESEKLRSLLEAARWAPSSYNNQPWRFIIADRSDPAAHARLLGCLVEFNQAWARQAPVLVLTVAQKHFTHNGQPNPHAWHDVGLATENLMVQATALGLHVHAMAGLDPEKARRELRIPNDYEPVAALALGYLGDADTLPDDLREKEVAPRERRPLGELVFSGQWGQAATLTAG